MLRGQSRSILSRCRLPRAARACDRARTRQTCVSLGDPARGVGRRGGEGVGGKQRDKRQQPGGAAAGGHDAATAVCHSVRTEAYHRGGKIVVVP